MAIKQFYVRENDRYQVQSEMKVKCDFPRIILIVGKAQQNMSSRFFIREKESTLDPRSYYHTGRIYMLMEKKEEGTNIHQLQFPGVKREEGI